MELQCITVDCVAPARLAEFWSAALGWRAPTTPAGSAAATCRPDVGGPYLEFVPVAEPKTVKNRLHLECHVGSIDEHDAEVQRLLALGASLAWKEIFPPDVEPSYRNWVLLDPEGTEFCLGGGSWPPGVPMPDDVPIRRVPGETR